MARNKPRRKGEKKDYFTYLECREIAHKQSTKEKVDQDFLCVRVNWRTAYKMTKHCVICGSMEKVEMHHIKHVRTMGKTSEGLKQVISILINVKHSDYNFQKKICTTI